MFLRRYNLHMVRVAKAIREHKDLKVSKAPVAHSIGRRKSSVARVWLYRGKGEITINDRTLNDYCNTHTTRTAVTLPLTVVPQIAQFYDIKVTVHGGGPCSQPDAMKLGIARALVELHPDIRGVLREYNLLTVDGRLKERKKYGQKAARRKFQFVKR
jgi:small subunit ribosomal protein S9